MATLAAVYVYQGPWSYFSTRDQDGNWSSPTIFAASSESSNGVSTGYVTTDFPNKLGCIGAGGRAIWLGNGLPDTSLTIPTSNPITGDIGVALEVYWDASIGGWWIDNAWYTLLPLFNYNAGVNDSYRWAILKSIGYAGSTDWPNLWEEQDQAHSPNIVTRIGNNERAAIRWDGTSRIIDLLARVEGLPNSNCLYSFNLDTGLWTGPYGVADFGGAISIGLHGDVGNNIFRFPNDDIGVVYGLGDTVYYRLYVAATSSWNAPVVVKSYGGGVALSARVCTIIPDPSEESLHVFTINHETALGASYHVVPHTDAPIADCFTWDFYTPDAFGNGTIFNGQLAVPFDDYDENMVWLAPITGGPTTFVAENLPRYAGDVGIPSCASLFYIPTTTLPDVVDTLSLSDNLIIGLGLILDDLLDLSDAIGLPWSNPDLADSMTLLDLVRIALTKGSRPVIPIYDGCDTPENARDSTYCKGFKDYRTNTLEEIDPCDAVVYEVTEETSCI